MGNPGQPAPARCVVRLFDQQYAVNATVVTNDELALGSTRRVGAPAPTADMVTFTDMIAGSSSAVYRIGCAVPPLPMPKDEEANLVFDGADIMYLPHIDLRSSHP